MKNILWIFIGRMNPPHIWHITVIEKALKENTKVLVLLWTNWKIDLYNPLNFEQRKELLEKHFKNNLDIQIIEDRLDDKIWVENIWKIINKNYKNYEINFYGWDFKNDSAINVIKQYENILWVTSKINYIEFGRNKIKIEHNLEYINISSTNLRKALRDKNYDLASKFLVKEIAWDVIKMFI